MGFENIKEVIEELNKDRDEDEIVEYKTVADVVDEIKEIGLMDKVYAFNDDTHSLADDISQELLDKRIDELNNNDEDIDQLDNFFESAEDIIRLSRRELSEDDLEDIREDKLSRGECVDD